MWPCCLVHSPTLSLDTACNWRAASEGGAALSRGWFGAMVPLVLVVRLVVEEDMIMMLIA
jgi:hypothetical protein